MGKLVSANWDFGENIWANWFQQIGTFGENVWANWFQQIGTFGENVWANWFQQIGTFGENIWANWFQQIGTFGENIWANWLSKLVLLVKMFGQIGFMNINEGSPGLIAIFTGTVKMLRKKRQGSRL